MPPSGATSAPVWQLDRNAKSAIGGNGDGDAALRGCDPAAGAAVGWMFSAVASIGHLPFRPHRGGRPRSAHATYEPDGRISSSTDGLSAWRGDQVWRPSR